MLNVPSSVERIFSENISDLASSLNRIMYDNNIKCMCGFTSSNQGGVVITPLYLSSLIICFQFSRAKFNCSSLHTLAYDRYNNCSDNNLCTDGRNFDP